MPAFNTLLAEGKLVPSFEMFAGFMYPRIGSSAMLKPFRAQGGKGVKLFAKYAQWSLGLSPGVSVGQPNRASNYDMTRLFDISTDRTQTDEVAVAFEPLYAYSQLPQEVMDLQTQGGLVGSGGHNYINEMMTTIEQAVQQLGDTECALFFNTGYGKLGNIAANGSAIAASASGSVVVDNIQNFRMLQYLHVMNSSNVTVSDVILKVTSTGGFGSGQGTLTVKNVGGTSYTPDSTHQLVVIDAETCMSVPGLLHALDDTAYPRAILQNQSINNDLFKAHVQEPTGSRLLDINDFVEFEEAMKDRITEDSWGEIDCALDDGECWKQTRGIYYAHSRMITGLRASLFRDKITHDGFPKQTSPGWGQVTMVEGNPVKTSNHLPVGKVLRVNVTDFSYINTNPVFVSKGANGNYERIPGQLRSELILQTYRASCCLNRARQGMMTGYSAWDADEAGVAA